MVDLAQAFSEVKSLPDNILHRELTSPSGTIPGWLALGEIHERKRMRAGQDGPAKRPSMVEEYTGIKQPMLAGTGVKPQQPPQQQGMAPFPALPPGMPPPQQLPQQGMPSQPGIAGLPPPSQGYASGGVVSLAQGGSLSYEERARRIARELGMDENIAIAVGNKEGGFRNPIRQGEWVNASGRREPSYGPYQLLIGGPGTGYPSGLGNRALARGIDPRDPAQYDASTRFALTTAKNEGWGQWYGWKGDKWAGIRDRGTGVYEAAGQAIDPNATASYDPNVDVATSAADTAEKMATTENAAGGDSMAQYLLAQQLLPQAPRAPEPPPMAMSTPVPFDPRQFVQDPAFYFRNRERYG